jgi:hypothetical protein
MRNLTWIAACIGATACAPPYDVTVVATGGDAFAGQPAWVVLSDIEANEHVSDVVQVVVDDAGSVERTFEGAADPERLLALTLVVELEAGSGCGPEWTEALNHVRRDCTARLDLGDLMGGQTSCLGDQVDTGLPR